MAAAPGPWSSAAHLSESHPSCSPSQLPPFRQSEAPRCFLLPAFPPPALPASLPSYLAPPPSALLASELPNSITNQHPPTTITLQRPPPLAKGKKTTGGTATSSHDPLSLHFLHSRPFPRCRVQNGDPAQQGALKRRSRRAPMPCCLLSALSPFCI